MKQLSIVLVLMLVAALSTAAPATAISITWDEGINGGRDAGKTLATAQNTTGTGSLIEIGGNLDPVLDDYVDLFAIKVTAELLTAAAESTQDIQLFLFDDAGKGVIASPSGLAGTFTASGLIPGGTYYLGISLYAFVPRDTDDIKMFDSFGGGSPLTSGALKDWIDDTCTSPPCQVDPDFVVALIGAEPANLQVVPAPGTLVLFAAGLLGAAISLRHRRR